MSIFLIFGGFGRRKTKPNKPNLPAFGRKSQERNLKRFERVLFEKTKPILKSQKWRKYLFEMVLRGFVWFWSA